MIEYNFICPYCWENISMLLDVSVPEQTYIEDCEVCCNPIEVEVLCTNNNVASFAANKIGQ